MEDGADETKIKTFMKWNDSWFYKHVETLFGKPNHSVEYVPLRDYYHRHQRGIFWTVACMMPYANHPWFRNTFGWILPMNPQLFKLLRPTSGILAEYSNETFIVQDFVVPMSKMGDFIQLSHEEVDVSYADINIMISDVILWTICHLF